MTRAIPIVMEDMAAGSFALNNSRRLSEKRNMNLLIIMLLGALHSIQ